MFIAIKLHFNLLQLKQFQKDATPVYLLHLLEALKLKVAFSHVKPAYSNTAT